MKERISYEGLMHIKAMAVELQRQIDKYLSSDPGTRPNIMALSNIKLALTALRELAKEESLFL